MRGGPADAQHLCGFVQAHALIVAQDDHLAEFQWHLLHGEEQRVVLGRDGEGQIESLSADAAAMNQLRLQAVSRVTEALSRETGAAVAIPLGSLLGSSLFWARGPAIPVHALTAGTAHGEFESTFTEAGINQTLHRIELVLTVPVTILLPGGPAGVEVTARVTVAETVIVGRIPETYLRAGAGSPL